MTETTAPSPTNIADRLPDSVYLHIVDTLRTHLPEPPSKDPEHLAHQLEAAIAEVGSFSPANAAEAKLAARYVAFSAYAEHCLHLARQMESRGQVEWVVKCLAQGNATARQAAGQLSLLLRLQRERRKLEKDGHALNRAQWAEHCAIGLMTDALNNNSPSPCGIEPQSGSMPRRGSMLRGGVGPRERADQRAPMQVPEAVPAGIRVEGADRQPAIPSDQSPSHPTAPTAEPPPPDELTPAQDYAVMYPERAALIRRAGRVPDDITFAPPDPEVVQELLTSQDPVIAFIEERFANSEVY
jgi:hypothetical protein